MGCSLTKDCKGCEWSVDAHDGCDIGVADFAPLENDLDDEGHCKFASEAFVPVPDFSDYNAFRAAAG